MIQGCYPLFEESSQRFSQLTSFISASVIMPEAIASNATFGGKFPPVASVEPQLPYDIICKNATAKGAQSDYLFEMIKQNFLTNLTKTAFQETYVEMAKSRNV